MSEHVDLNEQQLDFSGVREHNYTTVPTGTYLCRVDETRPGITRGGHKRWGIKFVVHEGPEAGRLAAWDGLVFSPNALPRTKQVLAALGLPHEGKVDLKAIDLVGRLAYVRVEQGVYRNPSTGEAVKRNNVPYDGIQPADVGKSVADAGSGDEPPEPAEVPF